jgi:hypothetical protein
VRVTSPRQDSPTFLLVTNELDTLGIHDPKLRTTGTETPHLAQAVREGTKIKRIYVKLVTALAIAKATLPKRELEKVITWVMTQAILVMIPHRLIAPTNLTIPNLPIRRPQHPHRQLRTGVINVIDHIGVTVVIPPERLIGTVTSGTEQSGGVTEILRTPQTRMETTVRDDHLAETVGVDRVLTLGLHAMGRAPLERATVRKRGRTLGIPKRPMAKRTTRTTPVKTDTKRK